MAVREEIRFSFDTQDAKYLGTAFSHTAFCKVERFQVVSKQSFQEVFSLGRRSLGVASDSGRSSAGAN
jgi:hypothetical protein